MITDILDHLTPDPSQVSLPASVQLNQRLQSSSPPEQVTLVYHLDLAGDVSFATPEGPDKSLTCIATVDSSGNLTPVPVARLVRDQGTPTAIANIDQMITDSAHRVTTDACQVLTTLMGRLGDRPVRKRRP
jgi:hypothetical protein